MIILNIDLLIPDERTISILLSLNIIIIIINWYPDIYRTVAYFSRSREIPIRWKKEKKKKNTATEKSFSTMGQHERKKERFEVMSGHWIGLSGSRIRRRGTGSRWSAPVSTSGVPVFACRFPIGRPRQNCPAGWFFSREKIRASVRTGRVGSGSR